MHMCLLIKSKGQHLISSSATLPLILDRVYHRAQSSVIWLNCWPASLRDPPVSSSQGYDYRFIVSFPVFLHCCWKFELRSSWLQDMNFTNCCISPAVFLFSLYTVLGWLRETSLPSVPASLFQYFYSIPWSFVLYQEFGSISVFYNYSIIDIVKAPSLILWG